MIPTEEQDPIEEQPVEEKPKRPVLEWEVGFFDCTVYNPGSMLHTVCMSQNQIRHEQDQQVI